MGFPMNTTDRDIKVSITFKHTEPSEALRDYAAEKVSNCMSKFIHHNTEAHVVLIVEKNRHIAEVSFRTDGADFNSREESGDLYASVDALVNSLTRQLRKHKEKMTSHH
jgi:putative sigma-54 modulation protein